MYQGTDLSKITKEFGTAWKLRPSYYAVTLRLHRSQYFMTTKEELTTAIEFKSSII